jgi:hypothetical protein
LRATHGRGARPVAERAQIVGAVPAVTSQGSGVFWGHGNPSETL